MRNCDRYPRFMNLKKALLQLDKKPYISEFAEDECVVVYSRNVGDSFISYSVYKYKGRPYMRAFKYRHNITFEHIATIAPDEVKE